MGIGECGNLFWCTRTNDLATIFAGLWSDIDEIIGCFDDIEIMFDNDDGMSEIGECVKDLDELSYIVGMEPGGGFVEDEERFGSGCFCDFFGEFHALCFAAGECG